jgi:membrane protease YdiL (CAAX protease family)
VEIFHPDNSVADIIDLRQNQRHMSQGAVPSSENDLLVLANLCFIPFGITTISSAIVTLIVRSILGFGIYKASRAAAVFALLYSIADSVVHLSHGAGISSRAQMVLGLFFWAFVVKAAFTHYRLVPRTDQVDALSVQSEIDSALQSNADRQPVEMSAKTWIWLILGAICPPLLVVLLIVAILRPAIRKKIPGEPAVYFWIFCLLISDAIFLLPVGRLEGASYLFDQLGAAKTILALDAASSIFSAIVIFIVDHQTSIKRFKPNIYVYSGFLISLLPMLSLFVKANDLGSFKTHEITPPLMRCFLTAVKAGSLSGVTIGIISVAIVGPLLEELIFRNLLLKTRLSNSPDKNIRLLYDGGVCLLFGLLHYPISFVVPALLSALWIKVRRSTGSLLPSLLMHGVWNLSICITLIHWGKLLQN